MPVSYFERKLAVNEGSEKVGAEMHIGSNLRVKEVEFVLDRTGVDFRQETIKYKSEDGSGTVAGPSAGAEAGYKRTLNGGSLAAKAELSLARAEKCFPVTKEVDVYASANLNANTGIQIGAEGWEANVLGFGLTLGVGGKYTFNTPFGSIGGASSPCRNIDQITNYDRNCESEYEYGRNDRNRFDGIR